MNLLEEIENQKAKSVSIIGMAKNTGKTVTLNHILKLAELSNYKVALTTIGLDGEDKDKVLNNLKPRILIWENMIIANAKQLILESKINFEILAATGIDSPLGEIVIARSKERAFVKLSGPSSKHELKLLKKELARYQPDLILIDGALDRKSFSSPALTDAAILTTGAVTADSINSIVKKVSYQTELFRLKKSQDQKINQIMAKLDSETKVLIINEDYKKRVLKLKTALNNMEAIIPLIDSKTKAVYFNGALVNETINNLLNKCSYLNEIEIIVNDAAHIFINSMLYNRFNAKNGSLKVKDEINLIGITINPFSPTGTYLDPIKLLKEVSKAVAPISCYEVVLNKKCSNKGVEDIGFFK